MKGLILVALCLLTSACAKGVGLGSAFDPATGCGVMVITHKHDVEVVTLRKDDGTFLCRSEWIDPKKERELLTLDGVNLK